MRKHVDNINCYSPQAVVDIFCINFEIPLLFREITTLSSPYCPNAPCAQILLGLPHYTYGKT